MAANRRPPSDGVGGAACLLVTLLIRTAFLVPAARLAPGLVTFMSVDPCRSEVDRCDFGLCGVPNSGEPEFGRGAERRDGAPVLARHRLGVRLRSRTPGDACEATPRSLAIGNARLSALHRGVFGSGPRFLRPEYSSGAVQRAPRSQVFEPWRAGSSSHPSGGYEPPAADATPDSAFGTSPETPLEEPGCAEHRARSHTVNIYSAEIFLHCRRRRGLREVSFRCMRGFASCERLSGHVGRAPVVVLANPVCCEMA